MGNRNLLPVIQGAGGKGSGGGATEAPDSLRSTQTADVLDLLCEGEIEGLVNGLQSIYLDGVPLQNADGSYNFQGVQVAIALGTQGQASIAGADGVQNEIGVSVDVVHATPIVRSISDAAVDSVRITITTPQLSTLDPSTGDLNGSSFDWKVEVQSNNGGFVTVLTGTVIGKSMSRYPRSKLFKLPGPAPWDIRVSRVTPDSTTTTVVNAFQWTSYTEIKSLKLRYPNSALVRTRVNAQQFARIPVRSFDIMGVRVQVPNNWDPLTRVYTGVWDGTFKIAWTDNPAWIYYDLLRNPRYGLGRYVKTTVDKLKWELYAIARYCDGMVPDGYGGMEPRFRCGIYLATREQAYKVLNDLSAIFMGISYWMGSDVSVVQDAPSDPVALFTPSNVVGGKFTYSGSSNTKRHSSVIVWFNSRADQGKLVPEVVVRPELEKRFGVKPLELSPLGIWSRGQAHRIGEWALYSEELQNQTETHKVGMDGVLVAPGKIYLVADPHEAGERLGGRVSAATTSQVTLDKPVTLRAGESYTLTVMLRDPSNAARLVPQQRAVSNAPGTTNVLTLAGGTLTDVPVPQSVWLLQSDAVAATFWRCLRVAPVKGENTFEITGLQHYPEKYALIEEGIAFEPPPISRIVTQPPPPTGLVLTETPYRVGNVYRSRETISWATPAPGLQYLVSWQLNNGPWTDMPRTSANSVDVDPLAKGVLDVSVISINAIGNRSAELAGSATIVGKTAKPANVTGFAVEIVQGGVRFYWDTYPDDDYLRTVIKVGGVEKFEVAGTGVTWLRPALGTYSVSAMHFDTSLGESQTPATLSLTVDANTQIQWSDIANIPLSSILNNDDSTALGFNPTFSDWPVGQAFPTGWQAWDDATPAIRETTIVRVGTSAPRFAAASTNKGMYRLVSFPSTPLPVGTFLAGSLDIFLASRTSGVPGILVRLYTSAAVDFSAYVDTVVPALSNGTGAWQSVPWSARVQAGVRIYAIQIFVMASWQTTQLQFVGDVVFQNVRFALFDNSTDNKSITLGDDGILGGGGGGKVSITGLGYTGSLDATTDLVLIGRGVTVNGNTAIKQGGVDNWDSDVYSRDCFAGGAFCSAVIGQTNCNVMLGLNSDPLSNASYTSLDYAWYVTGSGTVQVWAGGNGVVETGPYAVGDVLAVTYDGSVVSYLQNGVVRYTLGAAAGQALFFDTSFATPGGKLTNIRFGPLTSIAGALSAAAAAAQAATNAQQSANSAQQRLNEIASDGLLTPNEKPEVSAKVNDINNEHAGIDNQAAAFGITAERTNYDNNFTGLFNYLATLTSPVAWYSLGGNTTIDRAAFDQAFAFYYYSRQELLNKIAAVAATRADYLQTSGRPVSFRVASRGNSSTTQPIEAGFYNGENSATLYGAGRSYMLYVIRRSDAVPIFAQVYDVYGEGAGTNGIGAAQLANQLNYVTSAQIAVVYTFDEPQAHRLDYGLAEAMYRCGASRAIFGSPNFRRRSAYVLIGIGGCGEGQGFEAYQGAVDDDSSAWCDVSFQLFNSSLIVTGSAATPKTLQDYSYFGDLNATADIQLIGRGVAISGNTATKTANTNAWDGDAYSKDSYAGGAFAQATVVEVVDSVMFGLNSDPTTDASYTSLDYAFQISAGGLAAWESNVGVGLGGVSAGDVLAVVYDGVTVRYLRNGNLLRQVPAGAGRTFFWDSSFLAPGNKLTNIRFGPLSAVTGINTSQLVEGAVTTEIVAPNAATVVFTDTYGNIQIPIGAYIPRSLPAAGTYEITMSASCVITTFNNVVDLALDFVADFGGLTFIGDVSPRLTLHSLGKVSFVSSLTAIATGVGPWSYRANVTLPVANTSGTLKNLTLRTTQIKR